MTASERLVADYAGTSLTIGPHPMRSAATSCRCAASCRAIDLPRVRTGRRVRTAGMVITRQRPGTAKGFVFLTLEDETGVANIIVRPDFYDKETADARRSAVPDRRRHRADDGRRHRHQGRACLQARGAVSRMRPSSRTTFTESNTETRK